MILGKLLITTSMLGLVMPVSAAADDFTHEGSPIGHGKSVQVSLTGPIGFNLALAPTFGVHCSQIHFSLKLEATGTGTVNGLQLTACTNTPQNLSVDMAMGGIPWKIHADAAGNRISITDISVHNIVTLGGMVVGESWYTGDFTAAIDNSEELGTVTLDDEGLVATIQGNQFEADVSGDLSLQGATQIGVQ